MPWIVQLMACHLSGAEELSKPLMADPELDHWEKIAVKFE